MKSLKEFDSHNLIQQMKLYHFPIVIEHDSNGYFVSCPALQGCYTQGNTYEEAMQNIADAVQLYIEDVVAQGSAIPEIGTLSLTTLEMKALL
jgi:predicted RNase H-like HicB family nuclease